MSGTLFGIPLSQRVDANGNPAVGWLAYFYAANTSTPANSYVDTGLSVLNPWPLQADASGTMGIFWLADGSYRVRATSADGSIVYYDLPNVLAIGASSGGAPSTGVDPTAIAQVGDVIWLDVQGARAGWVRDNGNTIGSATSGSTERSNADCQPLFEFLWNNYSNTICPVVSGRGASALADWTANKKITLPDKRGYVPGGLDDMGALAAGRYVGVPVVSGSVIIAGSILGEASHIITVGEIPAHTHSGTTNNDSPDHTHSLPSSGTQAAPISAGFNALNSGTGSNTGGASTPHTHTFITDNGTGGGGPMNTVQKTVLGSFYRKL